MVHLLRLKIILEIGGKQARTFLSTISEEGRAGLRKNRLSGVNGSWGIPYEIPGINDSSIISRIFNNLWLALCIRDISAGYREVG